LQHQTDEGSRRATSDSPLLEGWLRGTEGALRPPSAL